MKLFAIHITLIILCASCSNHVEKTEKINPHVLIDPNDIIKESMDSSSEEMKQMLAHVDRQIHKKLDSVSKGFYDDCYNTVKTNLEKNYEFKSVDESRAVELLIVLIEDLKSYHSEVSKYLKSKSAILTLSQQNSILELINKKQDILYKKLENYSEPFDLDSVNFQ
jgi:hypothetical protein